MDKTYKIISLERKTTTTGKAVANVSLTDDQGVMTSKVSIWSDFQNFANLNVGDFVTGSLYTNDKGYVTLYPPKPPRTTSNGANFANKGGAMAKLVEKKQEGIRESQENKERGIKTSSTIRMAVDCAVAEYSNPNNLDSMETLIKKWRSFFVQNWDIDVTDSAPF